MKINLPVGTGVYETIAIVGRRPAFLALHLERLDRGAALLGIPKARERVEALVLAKLDGCSEEALAMRVDAPGHGIPGATVRPRRAIPEGSIGIALPAKPGPARSSVDAIKHTARASKVTARNEAVAGGAFEALIADPKGAIVEGTITNVFARIGDVLVTPGDDLFPLPGIARRIVLEEAARAGVKVELRGLAADELAGAREVFLTNAAIGVLAVDALLMPGGRRIELPAARELTPLLADLRGKREEEDLRSAPSAPPS
ncbi:MAG TPA: aminotransferase class IV [Planctomycetota bacterium]|nr:aminotransferase class IV [Planctomycetota bacterium]